MDAKEHESEVVRLKALLKETLWFLWEAKTKLYPMSMGCGDELIDLIRKIENET